MSTAVPMPAQRSFALFVSLALMLGALVPLVAPGAARAAPTELFFSEYIEGSSNNKALEIYNGTGAAVDLATGGYSVQMFFNGSLSAGLTIGLTGTVTDGDVYVVAQSSANATILAQADQTNGAGWFNGDDAVALVKDGTVLDVIGQIGFDPGTEWGSGLTSTADNTLRRNPSIEAGDTNGADVFDPAVEWDGFATDTVDGLGSHELTGTPPPPATDVINEFSANTVGTDVEYVEIFGEPNTDLTDLTILEIEGDSGAATGTVDEVIPVGTTDVDGLWLANLSANALENGTITLLLVRDFSGALGVDLDVDNDGAFDTTPWSEIVDAVAVTDGDAGDLTYGVPVLGVSYDGLPFAPGGASRIPDGTDTDTAADWVRNDFDLAGIPGFDGTPVVGEAYNTPGAANAIVEAEPPPPTMPDLVINEIDYDQPSTDTAEFIEIKNVGDSAANLDGVTLELVNGNGGGAAIYRAVGLPTVTLAAGDYFVVCSNVATTADCDLDGAPDTNFIENGSPDAVALRAGETLIDTVSYEGNTGAPYTEGSGSGLEDDPSTAGMGIARCPDGADTDQNNVDFVLAPITPGAANVCDEEPPPPPLACGDPATFIHEVQGSGLTSPLAGSVVEIEGVVVGDFQNNASADDGDLDGFHVQEEAADADADPATSEGIFVYAPGAADVAIGDVVRVRGGISEFGDGGPVTELTVDAMVVCSTGAPLPAATEVTLPVESVDDFERYEGMLVTFPQALTISEYFNFDRFGEIVLTVDRQFQPTAVAEPGSAEADAVATANRLERITLDDGRSAQNPDPAIHPNGEEFDLANRFRGGDLVQNATGVIDHSFGLYRIQPTAGADYTAQNLRPAAPEDVGGSLTVASFNVLNYFTTLDLGPDICGPLGNQECRGADTAEELTRQRTKIVSALSTMDADVVGLIEIENHPGDVPTADLVSGLNDVMGAGTYDYIETGAIGPDAIRVALIYKPASVTPMGAHATIDSSVDPRFDEEFSRPALAQSFVEGGSGAVFTVVVNHLKSKGSECPGDPDLGQGNCNVTRTLAAQALVDWLAADPTGSGDRDVLVIGDLNAYDKEDPIDAVRAGADDAHGTNDDYADLVHRFAGEYAYSYVFDGQLGYLDHALASATIESQVTGATVWHINADEPDILDYDTSFKQDAQDALYEPNAFRSSDHDPVIVGLDLRALDFDGFYPPIENWPEVNDATAGSTVPVKFSLGGDFGLDVLFETPQVYDCADWPGVEGVDAASPRGMALSYDPETDEYVFPWKTLKDWAGECKVIEFTFTDGTYAVATFEFRQ